MNNEKKNNLSESLEDYLEAIYHIESRKQAARAKDIAERLDVKGSSVTGALQALAKRKLINYAPYDVITLTAEGRSLALEVVGRHEVLRRFFVDVLDVELKTAEEAACRMEHSLPGEIFERLIAFVEYLTSDSHDETCKTIE
ncbi:MAG: metal-dependent transcriptional regulator, partial [Gemmatimonadota bacterium]|nr:metal-dependent transcriptional regulator [Gemmatimonadota bacterium]